MASPELTPPGRWSDHARIDLVMLLVLTFTTGIIDAVGYLGLDRVFTANMTGNVVVLGMGLAGADNLPVLGPAIALGAFMLGAALGGRAVRGTKGWHLRTSFAFGMTGATCLVLGVIGLGYDPKQGTAGAYVITAVLGLVMGLQAAAARRLAVADVTTVVVTSTLVGLASESRLAGGTSHNWVRRVLAVGLLLLGAVVGAALLKANFGIGLVVAGCLTLAVAVAGRMVRD